MKSIKLYEDRPAYGLLLKVIIVGLPALFLIISLYLWRTGNGADALWLLLEPLIIILIFWAVFPRSYQIFEDRVRIVLGGPFSVKVGFDKIKSVGVSSGLSFGLNFATAVTKNYVAITRTNGMSINITPRDREQFLEHLNRALAEWRKSRSNVHS